MNKNNNIQIMGKQATLLASIGALTLSPAVQAYESILNQSGTIAKPLNMAGNKSININRKTEVNQIGQLGRSMDYVTIEGMERNLAVNDPSSDLDFDEILAKGILYMNRDKVSMELNFNSAEVASSPHIQKTLEQPTVFSIHDPINDVGTIVLMESIRHSDGSAKMYQRFIGPSYFDRKSNGGGLTDMQYETMISELGQNPAEAHRGSGEMQHAFNSITPNGIATLAGLIMHHKGATFGLHINNIPKQKYWKTKSGTFKVKITHHLRSEVDPDISIIVPRHGFQGGIYPMYTLDQPEGTRLVFGGVTLLNVTDAASSFDLSPYLLDYSKKKESGWSGFAVAIFAAIAVAAVVATGGALGVAVAGFSPGAAAAFTFGVVGGVSAASGTFFDKATTSPLNVTSVTSKDSAKNWSNKFGEKPNRMYRDLILDGPTSERYSGNNVDIPTGRAINRQIISEWHNHIDPLYNIQDSKYDYKEPELIVQSRPDPDVFFDTPIDNPNHYKNKWWIHLNDNFGGGGEN